jgi:hypothetical protein
MFFYWDVFENIWYCGSCDDFKGVDRDLFKGAMTVCYDQDTGCGGAKPRPGARKAVVLEGEAKDGATTAPSGRGVAGNRRAAVHLALQHLALCKRMVPTFRSELGCGRGIAARC